MLLIMWSLYCVFPGGHGVLGALGTPSIMACLSLEHAWGKLKVSCYSFWKCIIALHWNEVPWWEVLVCTILSCSCNAMQGWAMVGGLCVLNPQVWCNAMMSYCGKFLCTQLSAVHSNFLLESFMYGKLQSHHKAREGPFELNDIFAIINAVPAITLMAFGFFNHGFVPGLCFGGVSKYTEHNCCSKLTLQNLSNVLPGKFSFLANLFNILWCRLWLREKDISVCVTGFRHYHVWHGLHVCAWWLSASALCCWACCRFPISPEGGCSTSGTSTIFLDSWVWDICYENKVFCIWNESSRHSIRFLHCFSLADCCYQSENWLGFVCESQLHHADLFGGIPYGLFLGPKVWISSHEFVSCICSHMQICID